MIRPIYLLGSDELRAPTTAVERDSEDVQRLIGDLIDTMHDASGIGLAAPQLGQSVRIFVVDVTPMERDFEEDGIEMPSQPMIFIDAQIVDKTEEDEEFEEGCLSIPDIHENVIRPGGIKIEYLDRSFKKRNEVFEGILARVIQHEYDHIEGVLFIDHLSAFKRRLLKRKLDDIRNGVTEADYPVYTLETGIIQPAPDTA